MISLPFRNLTYVVFLICFSSCISVTHIATFSSASSTILAKYDDINFSASKYCHEIVCIDPNSYLTGVIVNQKPCDCASFSGADKAIAQINAVLVGYFVALNKLSDNTLSSSVGPLKRTIDGLAANIDTGLTTDDITAAKNLAALIAKSTLSIYRRSKIKKIVIEANGDLTVAISVQQKNIQYLRSILSQEIKELSLGYSSLIQKTSEPGLIWLLTENRNERLRTLEGQDHLLNLFTDGLDRIKSGHQVIFEYHDSLKDRVFRKTLLEDAESLESLINDLVAVRKQ